MASKVFQTTSKVFHVRDLSSGVSMSTTIQSPGVYVFEEPTSAPIAGVGTSTAAFIGVIPVPVPATKEADKAPKEAEKASAPLLDTVKLCTNFSEFKKFLNLDFSADRGQSLLAHAVFGFFRTRCFVIAVAEEKQIGNALGKLEAIDEVAIVAAPGITTRSVLAAIGDHCKDMGDRVAIFDTPEEIADQNGNLDTTPLTTPTQGKEVIPGDTDYAALYFPWIEVFDPAGNKNIFVPPSGHIAGVYARVDALRGVFKAPANEPVLGAIGLRYEISKIKQSSLNPIGVNCIRALNGNIRVWGARTLGGDRNGVKYINVRRLLNYLRESIDEGTQWAVFEPNSPDLWAKIRRNVNAFLLTVWRSGALFGTTPEQAFFVKCDEETNPPDLRDKGQVVTEIGVAIVKPAEFVIFRISQWSGGQ
jgi:uncharacterized protein